MQLSMSWLSPDRNDRGTRACACAYPPASYRCVCVRPGPYSTKDTYPLLRYRCRAVTSGTPVNKSGVPCSFSLSIFSALRSCSSSSRLGVLARGFFLPSFFFQKSTPDTPRWITVPFNLRLMENAGWMEIRGVKGKKVASRDN